MKKFNQTFDLTNREVLHMLMEAVSEAHVAVQQIEAGIEGTKDQKAEASFLFLDLIGYLPNFIESKGRLLPVVAKGLKSVMNGFYFVDYEMEDGRIATFPLFGPTSGAGAIMASVKDLTDIIQAAFPKAVIQMTTGTSKTGQTIYHTTVRPAFIQDDRAGGFPVESGSAECSNASVSLMQATIRMIAAQVMGAMGAALAIDLHKAIQPKRKTLAEVANEKYGTGFSDMVKRAIAQPKSKADYDALPDGAAYIAPDGSRRIKGQ